MREIKFRAFVTRENSNAMIEHKYLDLNHLLHPVTCDDKPYKYYVGNDGFHVMQYTGLLDKNGAEIYEGDIVKIEIDFGYGNQPLYGEVAFDKCGFIYRHKTEGDRALFGIDSNMGCEVIGNIYENKELLK